MKLFLVCALALLVSCSSNSTSPDDNTNTEQNGGDNNGGDNNGGDNNGGDNNGGDNGGNTIPPGSDKYGVRIIRLYPYPYGVENNNETIDLQNFGPAPVSLSGWKVRDNDSAVWDLSRLGTIERSEKEYYKCLAPAQMDNEGDTLYLIDNEGDTIQTVTYCTFTNYFRAVH